MLRLSPQADVDQHAQPRFTKTPTDQIGVSGGVASFVCQASGDPKPQVVWNKKGKKVNSQRIETIEYDDGAGAVLRIQPLRAPRDENIYECVAQNSQGEMAVTAKLAIIRGEPPEAHTRGHTPGVPAGEDGGPAASFRDLPMRHSV
ncbi:unnamed protein product [Boreogadus saida]